MTHGVSRRKVTTHKCFKYLPRLNVETKPIMKWWVKLNQWKIWKTKPTENLHQPWCTFKCRKVITHECAHINVLSIETSSCSNVEIEPGMWSGVVMGKLNQFKIYIWEMEYWYLPLWKNKNGCHFVNMCHTEKFQITDPPKFGSLVF